MSVGSVFVRLGASLEVSPDFLEGGPPNVRAHRLAKMIPWRLLLTIALLVEPILGSGPPVTLGVLAWIGAPPSVLSRPSTETTSTDKQNILIRCIY